MWFNTYFEGGDEHNSGVFEIDWEKMDGIKGSARKGIKALERLKVVWRYASTPAVEPTSDEIATTATSNVERTEHLNITPSPDLGRIITEPSPGEKVPEGEAADWRGASTDPDRSMAEKEAKKSDGFDSGRRGAGLLTMGSMVKQGAGSLGKELGLRPSDPGSAQVSRAASVKSLDQDKEDDAGHDNTRVTKEVKEQEEDDEDEEYLGVRSHVPEDDDIDQKQQTTNTRSIGAGRDQARGEREGRQDTKAGRNLELGLGKLANVISKMKGEGKQ